MPFNPFEEKSFKESGIKKKKPVEPTTPQVTYPKSRSNKEKIINEEVWKNWVNKWSSQQQEVQDIGTPGWWDVLEEYPEEVKKFNEVKLEPPVEVDYVKTFLPDTSPEARAKAEEESYNAKIASYPIDPVGVSVRIGLNNLLESVYPSRLRTNDALTNIRNEFAYLFRNRYIGLEGKTPNAVDTLWGPTSSDLQSVALGKGNFFEGAVGSFVFNALAIPTRKVIGLAAETGVYGQNIVNQNAAVTTESVITGISNDDQKIMSLMNGAYVTDTTNSFSGAVTEEQRAIRLAYADAVQNAFNRKYEELTGRTPSAEDAGIMLLVNASPFYTIMYEDEINAQQSALQYAQEMTKGLSGGIDIHRVKMFGGEVSEENPLGLSADWLAADKYSDGYRYGFDLLPDGKEQEEKYRSYLEQGMNPDYAGHLVEDSTFENIMLTIIDPSWFMGNYDPTQLMIEAAWKGVAKPTGKLANKLIHVVPGVGPWLTKVTAKTIANRAAYDAVDAVDAIMEALRLKGITDVEPEVIERILKNPQELIGLITRKYDLNAAKNASGYVDVIVKTLKKYMNDDILQEAIDIVIKRNSVNNVTMTTEEVLAAAKKIVLDEATEKISMNVYREAGERFIQTNKLEKWLKTDKSLAAKAARAARKGTVITRGLLIDTWLGTRMSWNVFNYADNVAKLIFSGYNPFYSIPNLLRRYAPYASTHSVDEIVQAADELEALTKSKNVFQRLVDFFKPSVNKNRVEIIQDVLERRIPGSFGVDPMLGELSISAGMAQAEGSILSKVPGIKTWMNYVSSWATRIERDAHVRVFLQEYLRNVDDSVKILKSEPINALIDGVLKQASPEASKIFRARLAAVENPTPQVINNIINSMTESKLVSSAPNLVADMGDGVGKLSPQVAAKLQEVVNMVTAASSNGLLTKGMINTAFDKIIKQLYDDADQMIETGKSAFVDTLPELPKSADEVIEAVLPSGKQATLPEIDQAIQDVQAYGVRAKLEDTIAKDNFWVEIAKMRQAGALPSEITAKMDDFFLNQRPKMWTDLENMQKEALQRLGQQAQEIVGGATKPVSGAAQPTGGIIKPVSEATQPFNKFIAPDESLELGTEVNNMIFGRGTVIKSRKVFNKKTGIWRVVYDIKDAEGKIHRGIEVTLLSKVEPKGTIEVVEQVITQAVNPFQKQIDAITAANHTRTEAMLEVNRRWRKLWNDKQIAIHNGSFDKAKFEIARNLVDEETYNLWSTVRVASDDAMDAAYKEIAKWFTDNGVQRVSYGNLPRADNSGWWRVEQQIDDIIPSANKTLKEQVKQVKSIYNDLMRNRIKEVNVNGLAADDVAVLKAYNPKAQKKMTDILDLAMDAGLKATDKVLFDYSTTENWMSLLGNLFPFVRFPTKNIPFWMDKFSDTPKLASTIQHIRMIQSAINQEKYGPNMPERLRYTVELPFTEGLMNVLGFDNTSLTVNPWAFFSFMQQFPGASAYKQRQVESLTAETTDSAAVRGMRSFQTITEVFGMKMWPGVEWVLGVYGLLGDDWYPDDWLGTYTPIVTWALNNVLGKDKLLRTGEVSYKDFDHLFREKVTDAWNRVFVGHPKLQWRQLNPDLMNSIVYGRENTIELCELPTPAAAALLEINSTKVEEVVGGLTDEQLEAYAEKLEPVFNMEEAKQIETITAFDDTEKAVFIYLVQVRSVRQSLLKNMLTTVLGTTTGLYVGYSSDAEIQAANMRFEKRKAEQELAPGATRRDASQLKREEYPQLQLVENFVYSKYPYAETSTGLLAEQLDSVVYNAKDEYYEYVNNFYEKMNTVISEIYKTNPGNIALINQTKSEMYAELGNAKTLINTELNNRIQKKMEEYKTRYPGDTKGYAMLMNGFETPIYTSPQLSEKDRQILEDFKAKNPNDFVEYDRLFSDLIKNADKGVQSVAKRKVAGFKDGYDLDIQWSPVDNPNYSEEEINKFLLDEVLNELYDKAPKREDYTSGDAYWSANLEYMDNLSIEALKTTKMQTFINRLMVTQGMTQKEAKEQASGLCTKETLYSMWRENDTIWDALEYTYRTHYIESASDEWYDVILPLSKTGNEMDYAKFSVMKEDLDMRYGPIDAFSMIKFIQQDYPGKWTTAELMNEFEGITMPSYFTRLVLQTEGAKAVDANINYIYYNQLSADEQMAVREAFGIKFTDIYLKEGSENLSLELRGSWLDALKEAVGETEFSWRKLPGVETEVSTSDNAIEASVYGLPNLVLPNADEWKQAQKLNIQYNEAILNNNEELANQLENDPLRVKWFGGSRAASYFWYNYSTLIPPFGFSSELRSNPIIATLTNKDFRVIVATDSMYDKATAILQQWYEENEGAIYDAGLDPDEYQQVWDEYEQYSLIPKEDKETHKTFLAEHPLLKKYFDAEFGVAADTGVSVGTEEGATKKTTVKRTSTGGGGGGGSISTPKVTYREAWTILKSGVGQDFGIILRMLIQYWNTGNISAATDKYLHSLYDKYGGGLSFEDWLVLLRRAWLANSEGTSGDSSIGSPKAAPKPEYNTRGSSGIRRS